MDLCLLAQPLELPLQSLLLRCADINPALSTCVVTKQRIDVLGVSHSLGAVLHAAVDGKKLKVQQGCVRFPDVVHLTVLHLLLTLKFKR